MGSFSNKSVLPALILKMDYEDMKVSDRGGASDDYANLNWVEDTEKRKSIRQALKDYCKLDTLANGIVSNNLFLFRGGDYEKR